jgi:hypothetical protein
MPQEGGEVSLREWQPWKIVLLWMAGVVIGFAVALSSVQSWSGTAVDGVGGMTAIRIPDWLLGVLALIAAVLGAITWFWSRARSR